MDIQQKQINWMISFGVMKVPPESIYQEIIKQAETPYKEPKIRPSRGGEGFDWTPIKRGLRKMEKAIYVILKRGDIVTAQEAYEILLERDFIPISVYNRKMSLNRFNFYYHKIRKEHGIDDGRLYKINFIKANYQEKTPESMAILLSTTTNYVKQVIRQIKKGLK